MSPFLHSGLAGIGYALHTFSTFGDAATDSVLASIDAQYLALLKKGTAAASPDLFRGLSGILFYFLARADSVDASEAIDILACSLSHSAERSGKEICWFTNVSQMGPEERRLEPNGWYNLGTGRGSAGIIGTLGRLCHQQPRVDALALLEGAVLWVQRQRDSSSSPMEYPAAISRQGDRCVSTLGWCYGDLGLSCVIYRVARLLGRDDWISWSIETAKRIALMPIGPQIAMRDPNLCHGTAGVAHMFARLSNETGEEIFRIAARRWVQRTLDVRKGESYVGGFAAWKSQEGIWADDLSFLNGAVGVVLSLLAAGSVGIDPAWDRLLLLS
jgi:lantibiotic modifying enzyme